MQHSHRDAKPAPTSAAELSDAMKGEEMETNAFAVKGMQIYEAESVHY